MHETQSHIPGEELNPAVDLPNTFGGLEKQWSILDERQKVAALGNVWEGKKRIKGPNGDEYGLTEKQFLQIVSATIGVERDVIQRVLNKYKENLPGAKTPSESGPELQTKCPDIPADTQPVKPKQPRRKKNGTHRERKKPVEPETQESEAVVLTPERIREINRLFKLKFE